MLSALLTTALLATVQQSTATFRSKVVVDTQLGYLISLPEGYDADKSKRWPLLLFLHGAGERGHDLEKVKAHGPPKEIAAGRKLPFIVVSPQCPDRDWWSSPLQTATLLSLVTDLEGRYRVDRDREYVTGLSMGGFGTWALAMAQPGRFAAIAPVCGIGDPLRASSLKSLPIWAVHGEKDTAVPFAEGIKVVEAVKAAGGDIRFDAIKDGGHDVWTAFYSNPEFYDWLLTHTRKR